MPIDDVLEDIQAKIKKNLPAGATISGVDFEGPQLVLYTEDPKKFADDGNIIRNLAKVLRMRIAVRPDPKVLAEPERSIGIIDGIVPKDAGITNHYFDPDSGEVIIEAEKPGLVIGKHGDTLRDITKEIGWMPKVSRTPPIKSKTVKNVRDFMRNHLRERKDILKTVGRKIHREQHHHDQWIRVTSLGGALEVGRSCYLLSTPESKVMIDCGVNIGSDENMSPYLYVPEVSDFSALDAIILTHAHMDHQGLVPMLFKYGYNGPVYCTPPTRDMTVLLQLDYIDVAEKEGKKAPYDRDMIEKELLHIIPLEYEEVTDIAPDIKLTFHNAGHILGSAISHFHIGDGLHNIVFTGDYKYERTRLFDPAVNKFPRVETVITESTYGNVNGHQPPLREAERNLQTVIKKTLERNGIALIPAFAVGRSQEVMIVLEEAIRKGIIPKVPVYLDGMIWEATAIHATHPEYLNSDLDSIEDEIVSAAHYLATRWEFNLIYDSNRSLYGIDITRQEIEDQVDQHNNLRGVREMATDRSATFNFVDLIGQLRFQQRWARTPRIPKTAVLGHSLMVANAMYLHDLDAKVSDRQIYNDYYTGLFHDLPEVLTKDVITPIKVSVSGLATLLEEYEHDLVEEKILPLIEPEWRDEFRFMVYDPFTDEDDEKFGIRNGYDLKTCDLLAAYMEAHISVCYGVSSAALRDGERDIRVKILSRDKGMDASKIIEDLEAMHI